MVCLLLCFTNDASALARGNCNLSIHLLTNDPSTSWGSCYLGIHLAARCNLFCNFYGNNGNDNGGWQDREVRRTTPFVRQIWFIRRAFGNC